MFGDQPSESPIFSTPRPLLAYVLALGVKDALVRAIEAKSLRRVHSPVAGFTLGIFDARN